MIYHPQKREGFGLTDGEGSERVWGALQKLIAPLRVSGVSHHFHYPFLYSRGLLFPNKFHRRLYVLDQHIEHMNAVNFMHLGLWLCRKFEACFVKLARGIQMVGDSGHTLTSLRQLWSLQRDDMLKGYPSKIVLGACLLHAC